MGEQVKAHRHRWRNRGLVVREVPWSPTSSNTRATTYMKQQCADCPATQIKLWKP